MSANDRSRTKAGLMDGDLESRAGHIRAEDIIASVNDRFGIGLETVPLLHAARADRNATRAALDAYLESRGHEASGAEIRSMINETFGINLDAISSLSGSRISLFSKGQWIVRQETDLFIVYTGEGDVDVHIRPTAYFASQTEIGVLPNELVDALIRLGYSYQSDTGSCYFRSPSGDPVPDSFKGQTMAAIARTVRETCSHL